MRLVCAILPMMGRAINRPIVGGHGSHLGHVLLALHGEAVCFFGGSRQGHAQSPARLGAMNGRREQTPT